jgi:modulator of FtsH protease
MFVNFIHPDTYSWLVLGVFTLLTLIDFSRIRAGGDGLSPVQLAVAIYLDGINIFLALLELFGSRRR